MRRSILLLTFLIFSNSVLASDFVAGKDYVILKQKEPAVDVGDAVNVTEFFSYGCPWCYRIDDKLNQWVKQKGKKVFFSRVPVIFNQNWEYYAKAYYTLQALSLEQKLSPDLFKVILKDKKPLNSAKAMIDYLKKQGVDEAVAESAFHQSQSIAIELDNSKRQMQAFQINAIPAIVVNGQYKTDLQMAKNQERLFEILNFLMDKAKPNKNHSGND